MEELPEDLLKLWNERKYNKFLNKIVDISNKLPVRISDNCAEIDALEAQVEAALASLPELWKFKDPQIHKLIQDVYMSSGGRSKLHRKRAISCNQYVRYILHNKLFKMTPFARIGKCLQASNSLFIKYGIEQEQFWKLPNREELPEDLLKLWNKGKYKKFLEKIVDISNKLTVRISSFNYAKIEAQVKAALASLPELWRSEDLQIHKLIQNVYLSSGGKSELQRKRAISCNRYVRYILCTQFLKWTSFAPLVKCLEASCVLLIRYGIEQEQKLKVEDALAQECSKDDVYKSRLQKISVKFIENLDSLPLTEIGKDFPKFPGVYLMYYTGKTELYSLVQPSEDRPVYVGMSEKSILDRLSVHRCKIKKAQDLRLENFIVRFILVDEGYYSRPVEACLIEYFRPVWNDKTADVSFGGGYSPKNNWYKYHVLEDSTTIAHIKKTVKTYVSELKLQGLSLSTTP